MSGLAGIISLVLLSCFGAWLATGVARKHAIRNAILDIPNLRSSHAMPTPRGGGLAIVGVFIIALAPLVAFAALSVKVAAVLAAGGGAIALTGYLDDRRTLPSSVRFCVHLVCSLLVVMCVGGFVDQTLGRIGLHGYWVSGLLAVLAVAWFTNLFNFMDGIDGIAGSEAVFVAGAAAVLNSRFGGEAGLTAANWVLAAAALGFLIWNWPPARVFMGDVGSGFLGFSLIVLGLAMSRQGALPFEAWMILSGVFLVDATVTLLQRVARRERWFEAHRSHAYQILARRWGNHLPVTVLIIAINLGWLLPWAWVATSNPNRAVWCAAAALTPLLGAAVFLGAGREQR